MLLTISDRPLWSDKPKGISGFFSHHKDFSLILRFPVIFLIALGWMENIYFGKTPANLHILYFSDKLTLHKKRGICNPSYEGKLK